VALIPPLFLVLLESGPTAAIIVFIGIVLINGFAENVVKPKYMGEELDLSPFTVVFSVVFWSALLGPFGAILSVPMTMAFKSLVLAPDPSNRWLADLMSAAPPDNQNDEGTVAAIVDGSPTQNEGDQSG
jgi:predicted PurR-regulated permease PerM